MRRMIPTVSVINASSLLTDAEVAPAVAALQKQVSGDFAPATGLDAKLAHVPKGEKPAPGTWWVALNDDAPSADEGGYHDYTPDGLPIGHVYVRTTQKFGGIWTITASHEIIEQLGNPTIDQMTLIMARTGAYAVLRERCDACEDDKFGYSIDGIQVSDWVTELWFQPSKRHPPSARFDFKGHITAPQQLLSGGYIGEFHFGRGWSQRTAAEIHRKARPERGSRWERAQLPREHWRASTAHT